MGLRRPPRDEAFLEELARRHAERCGLPMRTAREHVMKIAVSANLPTDAESEERGQRSRLMPALRPVSRTRRLGEPIA